MTDRAVHGPATQSFWPPAILVGVGGLIYNILPLILGGLGAQHGFTDTQLGDIGAAYFIGFTLVTISAPAWVRTINWRRAVALGLCITAVLFVASAYASSVLHLQIIFALAGAAMVLVYTPMLTCLGDHSDPDRAIGSSLAFQVGLAALFAYALPAFIIPAVGANATFFSLAILSLISLALISRIPGHGRVHVDREKLSSILQNMKQGSRPAWIGLLGIAVFYIGITGTWAFVDRIARAQGLDSSFVGFAISIALIGGGAGALAPAILGNRFGRAPMMVAGIAIMWAGLYLLSASISGFTFLVSVNLVNIGWNLTIAYVIAQIAVSDRNGYIMPMVPAAISVGAALAPAIGGRLLELGGATALIASMALILLVALAFFIASTRQESRA